MPQPLATYKDKPEALIVGLAKAGDQDAFAALVQGRQSWIRNLMRRCSNDATLADDLAQQVFLQAWQTLYQLKHVNRFGPWLKRIAITVWLQHLRKNDALWGAAEQDEQMPHLPVEAGLGMDLDRALALLTNPVRLCIVLSYNEGMTHEEISRATDIPLGTVKSNIRRGAIRLKELLSDYRDPLKIEEVS